MGEVYPTQILKEKFVPIRDLLEKYDVRETEILKLVSMNKLMYALMKDPVGSKRIPHVNEEQLLELLPDIKLKEAGGFNESTQ